MGAAAAMREQAQFGVQHMQGAARQPKGEPVERIDSGKPGLMTAVKRAAGGNYVACAPGPGLLIRPQLAPVPPFNSRAEGSTLMDMSFGSPEFWVALMQIIGINIVLSGDNAVVKIGRAHV